VQNNAAQYGRIYSDIAKGFTRVEILGREYFFKHPTQAEDFATFSRYSYILHDAKKRGLRTEQEKIKEAIENGWWTAQKENRFQQLRESISNLNKTKENLLLPSQRDSIQKQIDTNHFILLTFIKERNDLVGYTAEKYTKECLYDETLIDLTYKNKELTERVFQDADEYYYLSDDHVEKVRESFHNMTDEFSGDMAKYVAASTFFQNMLYITQECDAFHFWGCASSRCTKYQINLLINGKLYKNAVKSEAESGKSIPDDILSDPVKFVSWYESRSSRLQIEQNESSSSVSSTAVSSFVGATPEDLKKMGVKVQKLKGKSLLEMAEENGGVLEKHQYLNAREGN
jgi:hypothetical protein